MSCLIYYKEEYWTIAKNILFNLVFLLVKFSESARYTSNDYIPAENEHGEFWRVAKLLRYFEWDVGQLRQCGKSCMYFLSYYWK